MPSLGDRFLEKETNTMVSRAEAYDGLFEHLHSVVTEVRLPLVFSIL